MSTSSLTGFAGKVSLDGGRAFERVLCVFQVSAGSVFGAVKHVIEKEGEEKEEKVGHWPYRPILRARCSRRRTTSAAGLS